MSSVRDARRFVDETLPTDEPVEVRDAAALCVTELIANVVHHTESPDCQLSIQTDGHAVRIAVQDDSRDGPEDSRAPPDAEEGRGLQIIRALARAWGVDRLAGDGKAIWVQL